MAFVWLANNVSHFTMFSQLSRRQEFSWTIGTLETTVDAPVEFNSMCFETFIGYHISYWRTFPTHVYQFTSMIFQSVSRRNALETFVALNEAKNYLSFYTRYTGWLKMEHSPVLKYLTNTHREAIHNFFEARTL